MILTVYYATATIFQSWKLKTICAKVSRQLASSASVVFYSESDEDEVPLSSELCANQKEARTPSEVLWQRGRAHGISISPVQKIFLGPWISFPAAPNLFPVHHDIASIQIDQTNPLFLLIEAKTMPVSTHDDVLMIEQFGRPIAWKIDSRIAFLLESDLNHFSQLLVSSFLQDHLLLNDKLPLVRIESVDVEGQPQPFELVRNHVKKDSLSRVYQKLNKVQWEKHLEGLKQLGYLANQAEDFDKSMTGVKPDLISFQNIEELELDKTPEEEVPLRKISMTASRTSLLMSPVKEQVVVISPRKDPPLRISPQRSPVAQPRAESPRSQSSTSNANPPEKPSEAASKPDVVEKPVEVQKPVLETQNTVIERPVIEKPVEVPEPVIEKPEVEVPKPVVEKVVAEKPANKSTQALKVTSRPSLRRTKKGGVIPDSKPPNILVYSDSNVTKENMIGTLRGILNPDTYTVYPLSVQDVKNKVWIDNTTLLVVCGNVPTDIGKILLDYFLKGGKMFCLCSDVLHIVLPTFRMAEVREHELVQFSYGRWKQVKMMHHVFCYQPSPVKKQFSSVEGEELPQAKKPSIEVSDLQGGSHSLQVQVLGTEETWNTPSLMLATNSGSGGKAVFSQIHLEDDPSLYESDEKKFVILQQNNKVRLEILHDILKTHLNLEVSDMGTKKEKSVFTHAYFLGRHEGKFEVLEKLKPKMNERGQVDSGQISLKFFGKTEAPEPASEKLLPILIHSCPEDFSTVLYFDNLHTEKIGRLVIYSTVMTSSMHVINNLTFEHGLVVIPRRQISGTGRHKNTWLGPDGCLMFSLQLHVPLNSPLGQRVSLVQHLVGVAVVKAILEIPGYEDLDIRLKWPNDIYANGSTKIGGSVINSIIEGGTAVCNIGLGINFSNSNPTVCLNDLIKDLNQSQGKKLPYLSYENLLATIFGEIERMYNRFQEEDLEGFKEIYYKLWLHSDAEVTILDKQGNERVAKVRGIDEYGYLVVEVDGKDESVHPDGNSFDMFRGLILPKI